MNGELPKSVLFVCNMNQVRSPMAEYLTRHLFGKSMTSQSAGIYRGDEDGFMFTVMKEHGIDVSDHMPETLDDLEDHFVDLVITLSEQAHDATVEFFKGEAVDVEHWPIENPSVAVGRRDDVLSAYRKTRDDLEKRISSRFSAAE